MNENIPSIFDGWEKQCFERSRDEDGANCAIGYARKAIPIRSERHDYFRRIGDYLLRNYDIPAVYEHPREGEFYPLKKISHTIAYANNVLKLTPEDFRRIDRETQIEAALKSIEQLSPVVPEEQEVGG